MVAFSDKIAARTFAKNLVGRISIEEHRILDQSLADRLNILLDKFIRNWQLLYGLDPLIGLYTAMPGEPNLLSYLKIPITTPTCFPYRIDEMRMGYCLNQRTEAVRNSAHGFVTKVDPVEVFPDLVLVPGLLFDQRGYRLGRGKGYFDRYLESHECFSLGVTYAVQVVSKLLAEAHDQRMHIVISEKEIIHHCRDYFLFQ